MNICPCGRFWGPGWDHEPGCKLWPGSEWDRDHSGFDDPSQELQDVALWAFQQGQKWTFIDVPPTSSVGEKEMGNQ